MAELQTAIATHRPGDQVEIQFSRNGKRLTTRVTLRDKEGNEQPIKPAQISQIFVMGAELGKLSMSERERLGISQGVKVISLEEGLFKDSGIRKGFVITRIDDEEVDTPAQVARMMGQRKKNHRH
ncbi:MAG: hypothetical protein HC880_06535 [Bacteroidia bacterium]|nr:hypothetical protein [Bacteroidia bacterium]